MLRFIIKNTFGDNYSGARGESYRTLEVDVPELEAILADGGYGATGFDLNTLVGVEVLKAVAIAAHEPTLGNTPSEIKIERQIDPKDDDDLPF